MKRLAISSRRLRSRQPRSSMQRLAEKRLAEKDLLMAEKEILCAVMLGFHHVWEARDHGLALPVSVDSCV